MAKVDITPLEALALVGKYLPAWKVLTVSDIAIEVVSGGYCSLLFRVKNTSLINTEPNDLLIRLYGGKPVSDDAGLKTMTEPEEVLLFSELSNRGLGPKLFGVFPGGMLTEFVKNHIVTNEDLENPTISNEIARNLARYHSLVLPIDKTKFDFMAHAERSLEKFDDVTKDELRTQKVRDVLGDKVVELITSFDFKSMIDWCRNQETRVQSRITLNKLDMNRLNCLIRDEPNEKGERVMLIDYDMSRFAPRGVDLGSHFGNYGVDLEKADLNSGLDYPSEEVRREFVEEYLNEFKRTGSNLFVFDDVIDSVDHVLMEAELYGIEYNLMGILALLPLLPAFIAIGDKIMNFTPKLLNYLTERKKQFVAKYGDV